MSLAEEQAARRKAAADKVYAEVKAARFDLYTDVVASTAAISDSYRREAAGSDYYCERTIMGLIHKALGL